MKENEWKVPPSSGAVCSLRQVFLVRKTKGSDAGQLYAMKVLKKATLKGRASRRGRLCSGLGARSAGHPPPAVLESARPGVALAPEALSRGASDTLLSDWR